MEELPPESCIDTDSPTESFLDPVDEDEDFLLNKVLNLVAIKKDERRQEARGGGGGGGGGDESSKNHIISLLF